MTTKAHAAGYCNIYPPSRIAVWHPVNTVTVTFGEGCARSGTNGVWSVKLASTEDDDDSVLALYPGSGAPLTQRIDFRDRTKIGEVRWSPFRPIGGPSPLHNSPYSTVKLGAVSYVSVTRSGDYHEVLARGYHYSPAAKAIVPSGGRPGQVQFRTAGSAVWRPVTGIRLDGSGRAVIRTWSPGAREYRLSFGEQPTLFDTLSTAVRAR